ncbi:MAG: MgtC/SapB family protein [Proteobacteria bacterium]|nr:MgtC/SapB family protein [Pseudomonadota bacterium]MDA0952700.1 MgtC/SapB family protein [Pseudomonadota bacterium]
MDAVIAELSGTATPLWVIALRFVAACVLGGLIGLEREIRHKPAGLRTHIMVALAAAAFTVLTYETFDAHLDDAANADPLRLIEAIVAGVAFLGAGAIIRGNGSVQGITTGTGISFAGAVGFACGLGYLAIAAMITVISLLVLAVLGRISHDIAQHDD